MTLSIRQLICVFACLAALPAHAYVDPGTGSMAIQVIIGSIVAAAFVIKTYYYNIKRRIARMFGRDSSAEASEANASSQSSNETKES
jgi:hypothetical protein